MFRYIRFIGNEAIEMGNVSDEVCRAIIATALFMGGEEDWDFHTGAKIVRDGQNRNEIIRLVPIR
jgi:hypothetical protein